MDSDLGVHMAPSFTPSCCLLSPLLSLAIVCIFNGPWSSITESLLLGETVFGGEAFGNWCLMRALRSWRDWIMDGSCGEGLCYKRILFLPPHPSFFTGHPEMDHFTLLFCSDLLTYHRLKLTWESDREPEPLKPYTPPLPLLMVFSCCCCCCW